MRWSPVRGHALVLATAVLLAGSLSGCATQESPTASTSSPGQTALGTAAPGSSVPGQASPAVSEPPAPSPAESSGRADEPSAPGVVITSGDSEFGRMLFADDGQAIYIWERETSAKPRCYGDCAEAWPPVLTDGKPVADGKVSAADLGTARRSDGTTQVTYHGHPLYFYADERPGEVRCHNVATHGGLWWVVQPNGQRAP